MHRSYYEPRRKTKELQNYRRNSILIIQFDIVYVEGEITLVAIECTKR